LSQTYDDAQVEVLICRLAEAEKQLAEVPFQVKEFVRDAEKFVELIERAAELLRSVVGDLLDERAIDWTEWQLSAQRWLRDAGMEK
jgi:hypothetical protein